MSIADMALISIKGGFDCFDVCRGKVEHIKAMIDEDCAENGAPPVEFHPATALTDAHFFDPTQAMKDKCDLIINLLNQAEVMACEVLAEV